MRVDKNTTLICTNLNKEKINDLLEEIFQKMGAFEYHQGHTPKNILLNPNDYMRIKKEKSNVLITKDGNDYILTMKIILDDSMIMAKELHQKDKIKLRNLFPKINRGNQLCSK